MSNQTHTVNISNYAFYYRQEIECYDALPRELREKLANAHYTISSKTVLNLYRMTKDVGMCLKAIEQIEEQMAKGII